MPALLAPAFFLLRAAHAQDWFAQRTQAAAATAVDQPHWATPLITNNANIEEGLRSDFTRQTAPGGQTTWNYGGTKGLQIIPFARTELRFSPPPFISHSDPAHPSAATPIDGFGDVAFRLKYRLYGSNEQHHNAVVSFLFGASYPTGKHTNGSCCAILNPNFEVGKGFGPLAFTTSLSATLPVTNTAGLGRTIVFNNALQYKITKLVWLQTELNSTFYKGGKYDGKQQTFTTPGISFGRLPLLPGHTLPDGSRSKSPLLITLGAGEQIALTHFNTYNHSPIFSGRLRF